MSTCSSLFCVTYIWFDLSEICSDSQCELICVYYCLLNAPVWALSLYYQQSSGCTVCCGLVATGNRSIIIQRAWKAALFPHFLFCVLHVCIKLILCPENEIYFFLVLHHSHDVYFVLGYFKCRAATCSTTWINDWTVVRHCTSIMFKSRP